MSACGVLSFISRLLNSTEVDEKCIQLNELITDVMSLPSETLIDMLNNDGLEDNFDVSISASSSNLLSSKPISCET